MSLYATPSPKPRRFTGRHMAMILVGFFAVVIGVNITMARMASATFGGVVVDNSYVASQHFNRWLDEAASEHALGWKAQLARRGDGRVTLELAGPAGVPDAITAVARHPLGHQLSRVLRFQADGAGRFVSAEPLPPGRWRLRIEVRGDAAGGSKLWRSEGDVQ